MRRIDLRKEWNNISKRKDKMKKEEENRQNKGEKNRK